MGLETEDEREQAALAAFPLAEPGQQRWCIWLDSPEDLTDESKLLIQLRVGKSAMVDGVNRYKLAGQIDSQVVEGWGYIAYHYTGEPLVSSTRMAPGVGRESEALVWTAPAVIPYNSRLPLVIYTPEKLQVSHRVLRASSDFRLASAG